MTPVDPRINPDLVPEGSKPIVIAKDQEEYIPLPSIVTPDHKVITRWQLTPEERERLRAGDDLFLTIWGTPIRPVLQVIIPVLLTVGPIDWKAL